MRCRILTYPGWIIFILSKKWNGCGNSSCMPLELHLYIYPSNDRGRGLFYLLTWMVWCRSSSWRHCCIPSIVFVYWPGMLQSIFHHCISRRCSFHMVHVASIGGWRILMTMVHMSLVYVERFRNLRRWQKVSTLLFCFCKLDFVTPLLVVSFWKLDSLCSV